MVLGSRWFVVAARGVITAAVALEVAGCGTTSAGSDGGAGSPGTQATCDQEGAFQLSLASDTGGQPTPTAAATWFAAHGGIESIPGRGWHVVARDKDGATLRAGSSTLHAVQGSDGTWQVDGGTRCG